MKNKLKKSKIIVPALALITATTAASVTGTVAWFTANQAVTTTISNFKAANLEGNLKVVATGNSNRGTTAADGDNNGAVTVSATGMADASFDGTNIYTDVDNKEGTATGFKTVNYKHSATGYYYAVSWTETFKVELTDGQTNIYNIFFDPSTSKYTPTSTTAGKAYESLRISMQVGTSGPRIVYAPAITASSAANTGYVSGTSSTAVTAYVAVTDTVKASSGIMVFGSDNGTTWTDENHAVVSSTTVAAQRSDYLGTTSVASKVSSLDVDFTAWFEGLDSSTNISDITGLADMSVTLGFYARSVADSTTGD